MITLTENAAKKVKELIDKNEKKPIGLRAGVRGGGCSGFSYLLDLVYEPQEKDRKLESFGVKVFIDPKSYLYLMGTTIDYIESLNGAGFKFTNPTAKRTCGCGESFSV